MSDFILCRLLTIAGLVLSFCIMTVLAHRTEVHAHKTRVLGLGLASALLSWCWWVNTQSFAEAAWTARGISLAFFLCLSIFYSAAVLQSRSILRWAGAVAACLLVLIGLVLDAFLNSKTSDVAIGFAISLLSVNFLGHLLRARVNQALLRFNRQPDQSAQLVTHLSSLLTHHPELQNDPDFLATTRTLQIKGTKVLSTLFKCLLDNRVTLTGVTVDRSNIKRIPVHSVLNAAQVCRKIITFTHIEDAQLTVKVTLGGLLLDLNASNKAMITQQALKPLYKLEADSFQTQVNDQHICISWGCRF